jgi:hypothetical protein
MGRDAEGAVAGEIRRALFLGDLARQLLSEIWREGAVDLNVKVARSNWVWRSLRAETFPIASTEPEAVKQHAAVMLAHVLDLPFMAGLDGEAFTENDQQAFVKWFLHHVLDPIARADESLAELVSVFLADLFAKCWSIQLPGDVPEADRLALQAEFERRINCFLNMLPDAWSDRIVSKRDLAVQLGRESRIVLTLNGQTSVPASEIARAYGEGLDRAREGKATAVGMIDAKGHRLTLTVEPASDAEPRAIISIGDRRLHVDSLTLALSHPDPHGRAAALTSLSDLVDHEGKARPADWEVVARTPEVEDRFWRARSLLEGDFHRQLVRLQTDFEVGRSIHIDEFDLPDPAVVAGYLDFDGVNVRAPDALDAACTALIARVGRTSAAARLGGLPLELSPQTIGELGIDAAALDADGQPWTRTPLLALMRLAVMGDEARTSEGAATRVARLVDALESGAADLFVTLVRHAARQAAVAPKWSALDPVTRITLLWVWADSLTRVFAAAEDLPGLADFVSRQTPSELRNH